MYECDHDLKPIIYGYMHGDIINKINNGEIIYGGIRKVMGEADWFCNRCLEDVYF
jgi:hypothetical protein